MTGKVTVKINGAEYTLKGDQSEDYLFSIANFVDKKVKEILWGNPKHSNTSAAVLAALTITDELFKIRKDLEIIKKSASIPEERVKQIKAEYDKLKEAYINLNHEFEEYRQSQQEEEQDISTLKSEYESLYQNYKEKSDYLENLLRENAFIKEQNEKLEKEIATARYEIENLKDQLLEGQIELVRTKKDLKDLKEMQSRKRGL